MPIGIVKAALEATKSAVDRVVGNEAQAEPGVAWEGTAVRKEAITKTIRIIEALKASLKAL